MKNRWEEFARDDAEFYILTHTPGESMSTEGTSAGTSARTSARTSAGTSAEEASLVERFFATGEEKVEWILATAEPWLKRRNTAVEIGCGVGRLLLNTARRFERVKGVDVSPTMLEKLTVQAARRGLSNVEGFLPDEGWDGGGDIDFAYSHLVFQHIEDWSIIDGYVRRIARALQPDGCALLQFDTRVQNAAYRMKNLMPDFLLPRTWRRGIRRIRRSRADLLVLFESAGLQVVKESGARTMNNVFVLVRSTKASI